MIKQASATHLRWVFAVNDHLFAFSSADCMFIVSVAVAVCVWFCFRSVLAAQRCLPPGPLSLPVIGNLHLFASGRHRALAKLSQKYGPVFLLRMGSVPAVVVSSPELAREFLHHHDRSFAHRPHMEIAERVLYGNRAPVMMEYSPRWRDLRKLYTQELLSVQSIQQYRQVRREEILLFLQKILKMSGSSLQLRVLTFEMATNIMSMILFSKRSDGRFSAIFDLVQEVSKVFVSPIIGELIPNLRWLDPCGSLKKMDLLSQRWDTILEPVLSERGMYDEAADTTNKRADMLAQILDFNKSTSDTKSVKASLVELLTAGSESTSVSVEWAMVELLQNPKTMHKLREELDEVVGAKRQVDETDFPKMNYLQSIMKETWRLHPPAPLLMPHLAKAETKVAGYKLPKNTVLFVNAWAIGRDENSWKGAGEFRPERFMEGGEAEGKDVKGRDFELLPFGSGRRGCPGIHLGIAITTLTLANLVHSFDWKLGPEYPARALAAMKETDGNTTSIDPPLVLIPTPRFPLERRSKF